MLDCSEVYKAEDPKTKELVVLKKVLMEDEVEGVCAHDISLAALAWALLMASLYVLDSSPLRRSGRS